MHEHEVNLTFGQQILNRSSECRWTVVAAAAISSMHSQLTQGWNEGEVTTTKNRLEELDDHEVSVALTFDL